MSKANTILVPLSEIDERSAPTSRINMGYVVETLDVEALQGALDRVVERWRLLAGRLEHTETWCIRVPLGDIDGPKFKFTRSTVPASSSTALLHLNGTSTEVLVRPPLEYFCDAATPNSLDKYASTNSPLLAVHVTQLVDCVCVGMSIPHGISDAFGMGRVVRAIDAELNGRKWSPPPFFTTNPLRKALQELADAETIDKDGTPALALVQDAVVQAGAWSLLAFLFSMAFEYLWHGARITKAVYLGENTMKRIVEPAKASANSDAGWISTGDILVGWFLKAAYLDEDTTNQISVSSVVSARQTMVASTKDEVFADYFLNAGVSGTLPKLACASVVSRPLAYVASVHRASVEDARELGFIQSYRRWTDSLSSSVVPVRRPGVDAWIFSNQTIGRLDEIYFGSPTYAFWHWNTPIGPDHAVMLNKFNGGYLLQACLRKSRWEAIEREVERIKMGKPRVA